MKYMKMELLALDETGPCSYHSTVFVTDETTVVKVWYSTSDYGGGKTFYYVDADIRIFRRIKIPENAISVGFTVDEDRWWSYDEPYDYLYYFI